MAIGMERRSVDDFPFVKFVKQLMCKLQYSAVA